jgi:hypothetical protein
MKTIEDEFFEVRVKKYIVVAPLCEYIQERLKGLLEAIAIPP